MENILWWRNDLWIFYAKLYYAPLSESSSKSLSYQENLDELSLRFSLKGIQFRNGQDLWHMHFLSILFGCGSWLCVNGLWVELPLLVLNLPEGWDLPSNLSLVVQLANIAPILYGVLHYLAPKAVKEKWSIYFVMLVGLVTTILLGQFWDETSFFLGQERSTALLGLVFFLAAVDCSSRVLYLPFMGMFQPTYLTSYFIGEGMSGFLPSIVALIQGVGGNPECRQANDGSFYPYTPDPRFSISVFFYFLFTCTLISLIAFILLNKESVTKSALRDEILKIGTSSESSVEKIRFSSQFRSKQFFLLLIIQAFVCSLANGALPSIQTYSCLPYGNRAYHLAVTLSNMANPAMCFATFFLPKATWISVAPVTISFTGVASYLVATGMLSPSPPLVTSISGELILIGAWILMIALSTYVRISVASLMQEIDGKHGLFWCGAVTQLGSAIGAIVAYVLVNHTEIFETYYPC